MFDDDLITKTFGNIKPSFLCNTSGSGKTRRILEGLTKYWGLYFVAIRDNNLVGVNDLEETLTSIAQYDEWIDDLTDIDSDVEARRRNLSNMSIARRALKKLLAARVVIFRSFLEVAKVLDGDISDKHRELWLEFQLSNLSLQPGRAESHPFVRMKACLDLASDRVLQNLISDLDNIIGSYLPSSQASHFIIALDEAQRAMRLYRNCFLSSGSSGGHVQFRSILRAIVDAFISPGAKVVVSGTGMSLDELEETLNSGVGKPNTKFVPFVDFGMFDNPHKLEAVLKQYIPSTLLDSESGQQLQKRIQEYLPGRYRFLISYIELLLANGFQSPHTLLNKYIECYTECPPGDLIHLHSFISKEPKLHVKVNLRGFDWEKLRDDPASIKEVAAVVQSHITKGQAPTFGPATKSLVEYGVARLRDDHKGHIIEPLAFLSVIKWFERQKDLAFYKDLRQQLANPHLRGFGYEEIFILYLLRTFFRPVALTSAFDFFGTVPTWANDAMQVVARLDRRDVPVNIFEESPQNPALCVAHFARTIEDIISWIEGSPDAPAVLLTSNLFGPDIIIRLLARDGRRILLMGQLKSYLDGNINELAAPTTSKALRSLNPSHWFKGQPHKTRRKLINTIKKCTVLRVVAGFPLPPNLNSTAQSVKAALSDLGDVFLATPKIDHFRTKFSSPGEVAVLEPMEDALRQKRQENS